MLGNPLQLRNLVPRRTEFLGIVSDFILTFLCGYCLLELFQGVLCLFDHDLAHHWGNLVFAVVTEVDNEKRATVELCVAGEAFILISMLFDTPCPTHLLERHVTPSYVCKRSSPVSVASADVRFSFTNITFCEHFSH